MIIIKELNLYVADTFIKRFIGFMFRKNPHYDAIIFKPCNSIHTFFMRFRIDVIFLDKQMKVLKKIESMPPYRICLPVKGAFYVVEGKEGAFKGIREGCSINWNNILKIYR